MLVDLYRFKRPGQKGADNKTIEGGAHEPTFGTSSSSNLHALIGGASNQLLVLVPRRVRHIKGGGGSGILAIYLLEISHRNLPRSPIYTDYSLCISNGKTREPSERSRPV